MKKILVVAALVACSFAHAQTFPVNNLTVSGTSNFSGAVTSANKVGITGTTFSSTGIAQATNGNWFTSGSPDITYHSFSGDAYSQYFTSALTQFTSTQSSPKFETGLTVNFKSASSSDTGGILVNNYVAGTGSTWNQANDMIVGSSWSVPGGGVAYNTEIDVTNNAFDPLSTTSSIYALVLGGYAGSYPINAYMNVSPGATSSSNYGAHYGIMFAGTTPAYSIKDATIWDNTSSTRGYYMQGSHVNGIDLSGGTFSGYPIIGSNFNIDANGNFNKTSDARLKNARPDVHLDGLKTLRKIRIRNFEFKNRPGIVHEGVFAQELYAVYPQCVHKGGDDPKTDPWSVDYGCLTPLLIRSVQQLSAELDAKQR